MRRGRPASSVTRGGGSKKCALGSGKNPKEEGFFNKGFLERYPGTLESPEMEKEKRYTLKLNYRLFFFKGVPSSNASFLMSMLSFYGVLLSMLVILADSRESD